MDNATQAMIDAVNALCAEYQAEHERHRKKMAELRVELERLQTEQEELRRILSE